MHSQLTGERAYLHEYIVYVCVIARFSELLKVSKLF